MDPRYIERKETILAADPHKKQNAWSGPAKHKRDIMPDCVLKLVRGWLPNPPAKPYMGHKWS